MDRTNNSWKFFTRLDIEGLAMTMASNKWLDEILEQITKDHYADDLDVELINSQAKQAILSHIEGVLNEGFSHGDRVETFKFIRAKLLGGKDE